MKTISSKEAQNSFGAFLDTVGREPVMVTRRNRPVGVMLSMENLPEAIFDLADSMKETIKAGVKAGLADAKAGRMHDLTDDYIETLKIEAEQRIHAKNMK
ncbi:Probable prevent-host-death protein [uncultured Candidatus Thioglobus sp.]|nr:Probable prevent-host-death protein [uncultured Candidatus Thioglobus sp.]